MSSNNYKNFALHLAREAGTMMKANFVRGMKKEWKSDNTPLTETDVAVNDLVIKSVKQTFPTHGVLGEEASVLTGQEQEIWVVDPIDGTLPFSHGYPTFVFSLALTVKGKSILGVIYDPILDRLAFAEKGQGTFINGQPSRVSTATNLNKSIVHVDAYDKLFGIRKILRDQGAWTPSLLSAVYASLQVATGDFVGEIFEYPNPWDGAAVKIIVEEAGGKVTDLEGNEQGYDQPINGFIASNGILHSQLLTLVSQAR